MSHYLLAAAVYGLNLLDALTTHLALHTIGRGREANPFMVGIATDPVLLWSVKVVGVGLMLWAITYYARSRPGQGYFILIVSLIVYSYVVINNLGLLLTWA